MEHRFIIDVVVLVIYKHLCLHHKQGFPGLPVGKGTLCQRPGGADGGRQRLFPLLAPGLDRFILEDGAFEPLHRPLHSVRIRKVHPL